MTAIHDARDVVCVKCNATVDQWCVSPTGRPVRYYHVDRVVASRIARAQKRGVTVNQWVGPTVGRRFRAECHIGDCTWKGFTNVVKVAAEDEARAHRAKHRQEAK